MPSSVVLYGRETWVSDNKGGMWVEGVREQGGEENIRTYEGGTS